MFSAEFLETCEIVPAIIPVDLSTAANNGDWVNLRDYEGALVVLFKGAGTAGQDPVFTLNQATDASGTGSKALTYTKVRLKVGTLTAVGTWTTDTQTAANTYNGQAGGTPDRALAENQAMVVVDVKATTLDVTNNFTWIQLAVPDVGAAAQIGCGFYILYGARWKQQTQLSAIA